MFESLIVACAALRGWLRIAPGGVDAALRCAATRRAAVAARVSSGCWRLRV
jgi:hypothetical protein